MTIGTQFDYRGGHLVDNSLEQFRCFSVVICRGVHDRTAPIDEQARAQATYLPGGGFDVAFFEPGWFIKLRELSLTMQAPDGWARAFRANRLSFTLAARNLLTIDDYSGVDPEVNAFAQDNFAQLRLRVAGAGPLLHRPSQRQLLRRGPPCVTSLSAR